MLFGQNDKIVVLVQSTAATDATASTRVDTQGYDYAEFIVVGPKAAATNSSVQLAALDIYEADTTTFATTYGVISGSTATSVTASTQFVIPTSNDTSNFYAVKLSVALQGHKRYLFTSMQPDNSTSFNLNTILCRLSRAETAPDTTTEMGIMGFGAV